MKIDWKELTVSIIFITFALFVNVTYATTKFTETKLSPRCNSYLMGGIDEPSGRDFICMESLLALPPHEEWRDVVGYEGIYIVSSSGNIMSVERKRTLITKTGKRSDATLSSKPLKSFLCNGGYLIVKLYHPVNGKRSFLLHRLVAQAFVPNPENKPTVNHKWGNKLDNRSVALEWLTYEEQIEHAKKNGLTNYHKTKIFTEEEIFAIRSSEKSFTSIAKEYGVYPTTISNIKKGISWKKLLV